MIKGSRNRPFQGKIGYIILLLIFALFSNHRALIAKSPALITEGYQKLEFREPHPQVYFVDESWFESDAEDIPEDGIPARFGTPTGNEVTLSSRIVLHSRHQIDAALLLRQHYLQVSRQISPSLIIFDAINPIRAIKIAQELAQSPDILACYPIMRRHFQRHSTFASAPNDTYIQQAWHVENRNSGGIRLGIDLNLRTAWAITEGKNVTVALSDNGIDLNHPDLLSRAAIGPHFNFGNNQPSGGFINSDAHGTAVAGLIAAEGGNKTGVIGVAPEADLSSLVVFDMNRRGHERIVSDDALMDMFEFEINQIDIQNHSWGSVAEQQSGIDALSEQGIHKAITEGRGGKGVVMVRAGGNEREFQQNANDDGFTGDPRAIAVGGIRFDGNVASYSTPGACLLVSAPTGDDNFPGVATTDHVGGEGYVTRGRGDIADYLLGDAGFSGTSASAPIIAGVAALILSQNSDLSYRDVQQILIHSAQQPRNTDPDIAENSAGLNFSHNTGYGIPDAGFAVQLAQRWKPRPDAIEIVETRRPNRSIPDGGLELMISGRNTPSVLKLIPAQPSFGVFADDPTGPLPIVFISDSGLAISRKMAGQAALIKRGSDTIQNSIEKVADAGAKVAVIFNNPDQSEFPDFAGTEFSSIPAIGISELDGAALVTYLDAQPEAKAEITLTPASVDFDVTETLLTEHVGVQINTTHSYRGDLRITLLSPNGTRSILQARNNDRSRGPRGWTYWSTKHFFESSAGTWKLVITDQEREDLGSITSASLIIKGVPILDIDRDGLDDQWERKSFGTINFGPKADPDGDGFNNAREQILETNPTKSDRPLRIELSKWNSENIRLSWPAQSDLEYDLFQRSQIPAPAQLIRTIEGHFPESEIILPIQQNGNELYHIKQRR
jgi:subtilisin family serine protease/subtilisin-like proprotein convertase family protein